MRITMLLPRKKKCIDGILRMRCLYAYFKRIQAEKHKLYKERQKRKENLIFLEDQINLFKETKYSLFLI